MESLFVKNIEPYLENDETLLWVGKPKKGVIFEPVDILKTIYVIALSFFTYFVTIQLARISLLLAVLIGLVFYSACLVLGVARFFIDARLRDKTFYGLTSKRIIIKTGISNMKIQSVYISQKPKIDFLPNMDNTATIDLGLKPSSIPGKGGITWIPNAHASSSLYRIADASSLHKKLKELIAS